MELPGQVSSGTWAIVLAGGEGTRLKSLTTTDDGVSIPKQFWSLKGGASFLEESLARSKALAAPHQVCAIVAATHRRWWAAPLASLPEDNVLVQPRDRGTGVGILYPVSYVAERDPSACVALFPSDHYVRDERVLAASLAEARREVDRHPERILLLGITPESPDPELGYILPADFDGHASTCVRDFVEKPPISHARQLVAQGALWSAFILVARVGALLALFEERCPEVVCSVRELARRPWWRRALEAADEIYARLPLLDFSRDLVRGNEHRLRVLPVPHCGWSDLGTPRRVSEALACLEGAPRSGLRPSSGSLVGARILAHQLARLRTRDLHAA